MKCVVANHAAIGGYADNRASGFHGLVPGSV